jgi:hypothetical protein
MMRITSKLGSWGMVILLLTRAPDGTSCWINTCLTKECRRQWRPTADPHVLLLLLLLLWQPPPPPSMAGGCLSPTWTCDWSLHVLVRCSNQRTQIEIARERDRERDIERGRESVCERERLAACAWRWQTESLIFVANLQFYQELQKLHTKGGKINSAPYKKENRTA